MLTVIEAAIEDMPTVRSLFKEYQTRLGVDLCFQGFDKELADLPGCYAPPRGAVLLASEQRDVCGCVAFRPITATQAELKRLYVTPSARGRGAGRILFHAAMEKIQQAGYRSVVLDTLPSMQTAQALYVSYGFVEIPPYYNNPEPGVKYLQYDFS